MGKCADCEFLRRIGLRYWRCIRYNSVDAAEYPFEWFENTGCVTYFAAKLMKMETYELIGTECFQHPGKILRHHKDGAECPHCFSLFIINQLGDLIELKYSPEMIYTKPVLVTKNYCVKKPKGKKMPKTQEVEQIADAIITVKFLVKNVLLEDLDNTSIALSSKGLNGSSRAVSILHRSAEYKAKVTSVYLDEDLLDAK